MILPACFESSRENQRGIALLITLAFIAVLMATALEMNRRMRTAVVDAAAVRDTVRARCMASSGVHAAMALLILDKRDTLVDSVQEIWADPVKIGMMIEEMAFDEGDLMVEVTDERARIQVNAMVEGPGGQVFNPAQQGLWLAFLNRFIPEEDREDDHAPAAIVNSIKDWLDSGDDDAATGLNGAESSWYLDLEPPYECGNGFMADASELTRVKGVTGKLYNGDGKVPGISRYVTAFGDFGSDLPGGGFPGAVNINTAEPPVLQALFGPDHADLVEKLAEHRMKKHGDFFVNDLSDPEWYRDVPGFESARLDPSLVVLQSDLFRIESACLLNETAVAITAVVRRQKDSKTGKYWCKVLSWIVK